MNASKNKISMNAIFKDPQVPIHNIRGATTPYEVFQKESNNGVEDESRTYNYVQKHERYDLHPFGTLAI